MQIMETCIAWRMAMTVEPATRTPVTQVRQAPFRRWRTDIAVRCKLSFDRHLLSVVFYVHKAPSTHSPRCHDAKPLCVASSEASDGDGRDGNVACGTTKLSRRPVYAGHDRTTIDQVRPRPIVARHTYRAARRPALPLAHAFVFAR